MRKTLLIMLMCIGFLLPAVAAEQSYTIAFSNSSSDASSAISAANMLKQVEEGGNYVTSFSNIANAYAGVYGIKMSSSKSAGSFTMNLSESGKVEATKIVVNAKRYGSDSPTLSLLVNGSGTAITQSVSDEADYTFDFRGEVSSLKFTSTKRSYIKSITIYYEAGGEIDPPTPPVTELSEPVAPIITPDGGSFVNSVTVSLAFADENSDLAQAEGYSLRYNLASGSMTLSDVLYEEPIELTEGTYTISAYVRNEETGYNGPAGYAEFSVVSGIVDVLTVDKFTSKKNTSYATYTYTSESTGITYEAQMAANGYLQLRSTNPSGIVIKDNPNRYLVSAIDVEWNSGTTDGRKIDFYGRNSAYSGPADLYSSDSGTKFGSLAKDETTATPGENYIYFGLRSASGALYLDKVTITYAENTVTAIKLEAPTIEINEIMHTFRLTRMEQAWGEESGDVTLCYAIMKDGATPEDGSFVAYPDTTYPVDIAFPEEIGDYVVYAYAKSNNLLRFLDSDIETATHAVRVVRPEIIDAPMFSPEGGEYEDFVDVRLDFGHPEMGMEPMKYMILYTLNGSDPKEGGAMMFDPQLSYEMNNFIHLEEGIWTINARVCCIDGYSMDDEEFAWSEMVSQTYIVTCYHPAELVEPVITPESGTYSESVTVTAEYGEANATLVDNPDYEIVYYLDCEPGEYAPAMNYDGPIELGPGEHTISMCVHNIVTGEYGPYATATYKVTEPLPVQEEFVSFYFTDTNATALYGFPQAPESGKDCFLNGGTYVHPSGVVMSVAAKTGNGVKWWNSNGNYTLRVYKGNTITFTAPGKRIASVSIGASQNDIKVQDTEGNPWKSGAESVVLYEPADGKNSFITVITLTVESTVDNYEVSDFGDVADFMETAKNSGMTTEDAQGNLVTTMPVTIPGKLHVIYARNGVAHLQDEAQNNIRLEGVPEDAALSTDNAIAEVHAYLMENKSTGVYHLVYESHQNHEDASVPVATELSLGDLVAAMDENPVSHMHNYVSFSNISYDHSEQTIYVDGPVLPAVDEVMRRAVSENAAATLGVRNDLGVNLFDVDADKEVNIAGVIDREGDSYVLIPTKFEVVTSVKAIYTEGISVLNHCINAPKGSRIFNINGFEVDGSNVAAGIYFVVTPTGSTVKCIVK